MEELEDDWDPAVTSDSILKPVHVSFTDNTIEKAKSSASERQEVKKEDEKLLNPYYDEKTEDWIERKYGKSTGQSLVLSCPFCFTPVCYNSQKHETYSNQYRAACADNCVIEENRVLRSAVETGAEPMAEEDAKTASKSECGNDEESVGRDIEILFPVDCKYCKCQVGVYDFYEKIYYFYNVLPGLG
eukprot:TRINITY_DN10483_c0_g1_i4.p1 TRINITY_DN10483_c0_g1~~TRINITY_DN10483_c0_g1_i4.p1  ORF type:complete len:187 (-),score=59.08 TRINITY_DN10483_c0_g1_i4:171-731(-)